MNIITGEYLVVLQRQKKDKKNHGYGLKNVYRIVRKYNGSMMVKREKDRFTAEVVIIEE
jgi:two-component system sensor histidine kinase AgrC